MQAAPSLRRTALRQAAGLAAAILAPALLSACAPTSRVVGEKEPLTVQDAHPIDLAQDARSIDIFVAGGSGNIGPRQMADVRAFGLEYRRRGMGPLLIGLPSTDPQARKALGAIRTALAESGVSTPRTGSYEPVDPGAIAPVKLAFTTLRAEVSTKCGEWPEDIANGKGGLDGWRNPMQPWHDFGCSTQNMMAQQVADPLDLVRGRPQGATSAARRSQVVIKFEKGEPTASQYSKEGQEKIVQGVGQ